MTTKKSALEERAFAAFRKKHNLPDHASWAFSYEWKMFLEGYLAAANELIFIGSKKPEISDEKITQIVDYVIELILLCVSYKDLDFDERTRWKAGCAFEIRKILETPDEAESGRPRTK